MYVAQVKFTAANKALYDQFEERLSHSIYGLFGAWRQNGQILISPTVLAIKKTGISGFVNLPDKDALTRNYDNVYVQNAYKELTKAGLRKPVVNLLSDISTEGENCRCINRKGFILMTTFLWENSPLHCSQCFGAIPLYQIPHTNQDDYYDLLQWQNDYQACDTLQMGSETGQRFAIREMGNLISSLSKRGLRICEQINALTGKPVYYYLYRYHGKNYEMELKRKCPSCNGEWLLKKPWHGKFNFRCKRCRLLSNVAWDLR